MPVPGAVRQQPQQGMRDRHRGHPTHDSRSACTAAWLTLRRTEVLSRRRDILFREGELAGGHRGCELRATGKNARVKGRQRWRGRGRHPAEPRLMHRERSGARDRCSNRPGLRISAQATRRRDRSARPRSRVPLRSPLRTRAGIRPKAPGNTPASPATRDTTGALASPRQSAEVFRGVAGDGQLKQPGRGEYPSSKDRAPNVATTDRGGSNPQWHAGPRRDAEAPWRLGATSAGHPARRGFRPIATPAASTVHCAHTGRLRVPVACVGSAQHQRPGAVEPVGCRGAMAPPAECLIVLARLRGVTLASSAGVAVPHSGVALSGARTCWLGTSKLESQATTDSAGGALGT